MISDLGGLYKAFQVGTVVLSGVASSLTGGTALPGVLPDPASLTSPAAIAGDVAITDVLQPGMDAANVTQAVTGNFETLGSGIVANSPTVPTSEPIPPPVPLTPEETQLGVWEDARNRELSKGLDAPPSDANTAAEMPPRDPPGPTEPHVDGVNSPVMESDVGPLRMDPETISAIEGGAPMEKLQQIQELQQDPLTSFMSHDEYASRVEDIVEGGSGVAEDMSEDTDGGGGDGDDDADAEDDGDTDSAEDVDDDADTG